MIGFHANPLAAIVVGFLAEILWLGWRPSSFRRLLRAPDRSQFTDLAFATISIFGALHVFEFASNGSAQAASVASDGLPLGASHRTERHVHSRYNLSRREPCGIWEVHR